MNYKDHCLVRRRFRFSAGDGFSLIELLITLVVAGILAALAAPSFTNLLKNNRLTTQTNEFVATLQLARQNAVSRGLPVLVCHTNNADVTAVTCNGGTASNWHTGVLVYSLPKNTINSSVRAFASATDEIIKQTKFTQQESISTANTNAGNMLGFSSNGMLFGPAGSATFTLCDDRTGEQGSLITITATGSIRTSDTTCS